MTEENCVGHDYGILNPNLLIFACCIIYTSIYSNSLLCLIIMIFNIDTSKRRHVMRGKQATVNKKIKDILDEYCLLFSLNVKTVFESCEKGVFAWQNVHDVSITGSGEYTLMVAFYTSL